MATQTWDMAYKAARNMGKTHEWASAYADRVMRDWNAAPSEFDTPARRADKLAAGTK